MPTKTTLINKAKLILDRIFGDKVITPENGDVVQSVVKAPSSTLADELSRFIKSKQSYVTETDKKVGLFIVCRKKTIDLENLHRAFIVIPPTSVEA